MLNVTQVQPRIRVLTQNDRYGKFAVEPFDKGYGQTLGASLRRVLLSSIEGVAITAIQVQGVQHEFSTMPGVVEDMMEIVLNLKEISIKSLNGRLEGPVAARIDKQGEGRITGADVQLPTNLQIVSPEKPICTLSRGDARFDAVLTIENGKGYVPSGMQERSKTIGTIPVDAIFSPVTRVNYFVEPTRVGQQTELDRLVLEISTNGALARRLHWRRRRNHDRLSGTVQQRRGRSRARPTFAEAGPTSRARDIKIDDLDFSNRTYNCLKRQGIETLGRVAQLHRGRVDEDSQLRPEIAGRSERQTGRLRSFTAPARHPPIRRIKFECSRFWIHRERSQEENMRHKVGSAN